MVSKTIPIRVACILVVLTAALVCAPAVAGDFQINLDPPGPREFILDKAGKLDSAVVEYKASLRLAPNSDTTWNNLGRAYLAQRDWRSAIDAFKQALSRDPDFSVARSNLAEAYLSAGFRDSAELVVGSMSR